MSQSNSYYRGGMQSTSGVISDQDFVALQHVQSTVMSIRLYRNLWTSKTWLGSYKSVISLACSQREFTLHRTLLASEMGTQEPRFRINIISTDIRSETYVISFSCTKLCCDWPCWESKTSTQDCPISVPDPVPGFKIKWANGNESKILDTYHPESMDVHNNRENPMVRFFHRCPELAACEWKWHFRK